MPGGISKLDLKRINRMQVLRTIWEAGPVSRVDLSQKLQITRASITQITNAMIAEGILMEIGEAPYRHQDSRLPKGRRKILLDINANYKFVLGAVISEQEVTVGLCTMHMDILDKSMLTCNEHTSRKEIIQFIITSAEQMMSNSCLTKNDVLGLGVGVMPIMIGRMRVFYKDGILDFTELTKALSAFPHIPPVFCGNAVWLQALANEDLQRNGISNANQVYLHLGSHIHIAVLRPEKSEKDYLTYSYLTERCIVRPGGRQQDGYPAGSVRAQLSIQAMQARIAEVYSRERTPFLYSSTDGYIERITLDRMYQAVSAGDIRCEEVVREIMQDWSVLLHNLVCCYQAQRIVLHHFELTEKGFGCFKRYVQEFAGDDIAERLVCSSVEGKTDFLGGCSLVLLRNFYMNGGIPEQFMTRL